MLGTAGVQSDVALAAFESLRSSGVIYEPRICGDDASRILGSQHLVGLRSKSYRFSSIKASYLSTLPEASAFEKADHLSDLDLRAWLMSIRGIGPKVASWVVRNHRNSEAVAVVDVHIRRAGAIIGLYDRALAESSKYFTLEREFLNFARAIGAAPTSLDALMWRFMRVNRVGARFSRPEILNAA